MGIQNGAIPLAVFDNTDLYKGSLYGTSFGSFEPKDKTTSIPCYNNGAYGITVYPLDSNSLFVMADGMMLGDYGYTFCLEQINKSSGTITKVTVFKSSNANKTCVMMGTNTYSTSEVEPKALGMVVYNSTTEEFRFVVGGKMGELKLFKYSDTDGIKLLGKLELDTGLLGTTTTKDADIDKINKLVVTNTIASFKRVLLESIYVETETTVSELIKTSIGGSVKVGTTSQYFQYHLAPDLFSGKLIVIPINERLEIREGTTVISSLLVSNSDIICKLLTIRNGKITFTKGIQPYGQVTASRGLTMYTTGNMELQQNTAVVSGETVITTQCYKIVYNFNDKITYNDNMFYDKFIVKRIDNEWTAYLIDNNHKNIIACNTNSKTINKFDIHNMASTRNTEYERNSLTVPIFSVYEGNNAGVDSIIGEGLASDYRINRCTFRQYTSIKSLGIQEKLWVERGEKWRCNKEGAGVYIEILPDKTMNVLGYISTFGTPAPVDCFIGLIANKGNVLLTKQTNIDLV